MQLKYDFGDGFHYEPNLDDVVRELADIEGVSEATIVDNLDQYIERNEVYLEDAFKDEARDAYEETRLREKNIYAYHGVSRGDFF